MKGNKNPNQNYLVTENPKYAINNVDNYYKNINYSYHDILTKFVSSLTEYLVLVSEKIHIKKTDCYNFIIERGVDTISHVFSIILYYTKNLDLAFYHSQKAYYFYIEFIEQISDDNVTFLQLSSKDATTFVYKKTIYEINNDYKKNVNELTNDEKSILKYVDTYMYIYKILVQIFLSNQNNQNNQNNTENTNKNKNKYVDTFCHKLLTIHNLDANKSKIKQSYLDCIYLFTNLLAYKQNVVTDLNSTFTLVENIFKHFISISVSVSKKKQIDDKIIKQNIHLYFQEEIDFEQIFTAITPFVKQ
jgi:hypothetical protein